MEVNEQIEAKLNCSPKEFAKKYQAYKKAKEEFEAIYIPFKEGLIKMHEEDKAMPKSIVVGNLKLIYVAPSLRTSIDSKKLQEEEPELYKKFTKTTPVNASIRLDEV